MERITIIGLGLIGGSIGLALKQQKLENIEVVGTARTRDTNMRAKKLGAIDDDIGIPAEAVRGARLVIVATPILAIRPIFEEIGPALAEGAVVTDAGSTKTNVIAWAKELLPPHTQFVGGHPMAGKETQGIEAADAALFHDKTWVLTPGADASERAVQTALGLVRACGANPLYMDPQEHDSYVAAISHLPLALSSALFSMAFNSTAWPELAGLASSGFRDTTRLASGSPEMAHDIAITNRENLIHWIDRFQAELSRLRETIATGESRDLLEAFARPQLERDNFMINGPPRREMSGPPVETVGLGDLLLGSWLSGQLKKQQEIIRASEEREKKRR